MAIARLPNNTASLFNCLVQHIAMAKYLLALSIAFALLLAGCAGIAGNPYNGGSGKGGHNGTALVTFQDVVSGCGIQPPDGNYSACGVHSSAPYVGKVEVSAIDVTGLDLATASPQELEAKTSNLGELSTNSKGELSISLPAGNYVFTFSAGNSGIMAGPIKIEAGKTTQVAADFVKQVPGTRPY